MGADRQREDNGMITVDECAECTLPDGVRVYNSRMAGNLVATCDACGYLWGYWDCVCELTHECEVTA
jgi:hypothetical protein